MAIRKDTIGAQIKRIMATHNKLDRDTGMLYNSRRELAVKRKKITMLGLFVSDEGTFLVRPHLFRRREKLDAAGWNNWLAENYGTILRERLLPGMGDRTGKHWRLYRIIGWVANDNTGLRNTKAHSQRNKTKRARR